MISNLSFLNSIGETHNEIRNFSLELNKRYPEFKVRFDIAFYTPKDNSITSILWEINFENGDVKKYFTFEISNTNNNWSIDAYLSNQINLEFIQSFVEIESMHLEELLKLKDHGITKFKEECLMYLEKITA